MVQTAAKTNHDSLNGEFPCLEENQETSSNIKKLYVRKLKIQKVREEFKDSITERLDNCGQDVVEEQCSHFELIVYESAKEQLGSTKRIYEHWFDKKIRRSKG